MLNGVGFISAGTLHVKERGQPIYLGWEHGQSELKNIFKEKKIYKMVPHLDFLCEALHQCLKYSFVNID